MPRRLSVTVERFPLAAAFTIARGSKTEALVVVATIIDGGKCGRGECVPYARYGENAESVSAAIETARAAIEAGVSRDDLQTLMPAGAARNAVDCALWDLEAKLSGQSVTSLICPAPLKVLETAYTISLGTPEAMAEATRAASGRGLLKIKVGAKSEEGDLYLIELAYCGLVGLRNLPDEHVHAFLYAEAPRILFPFARRVIADATRDLGFQPLMVDPIDFNGLYLAQLQRRAEEEAAAGTMQPPAGQA